MKRPMDIVLSLLGIVVFAVPGLLIAVLIRLTSPGSALFRQVRLGLHGKPFKILKFRTMIADAEARDGPMVTTVHDRRITPFGAWLRKTKLDELPQLINVLIGDMSLVGPRPEVPIYAAFYSEEQKRILYSMKPGITDYAAIVFRDESDELSAQPDPVEYYKTIIMPRKFALYQRYYMERSIAVDLWILFSTILALFGRKPNLQGTK